jgi:transcription antitermination factor NusA-like protein
VRVQSVVQELRGEKIDIVQWSDDPATFVANALSPAKIYKINVNSETRAMEVIVEDDQLSLAIGKKGQNVRLAAKLTKWRLDIKSRSEYEQSLRTTAEGALAGLAASPVGDGESAEVRPNISTLTDADLSAWPLEGEKPGSTEAPETDRLVDAATDDGTYELER